MADEMHPIIDGQRCCGTCAYGCGLELEAEVARLRAALGAIADGSFKDADAAADFAVKAMEIACKALKA